MTADTSFQRSQIAALESLLADLPADELMERIGLERRRDEVKAELDAAMGTAQPAFD